jgi:hypothetical protein
MNLDGLSGVSGAGVLKIRGNPSLQNLRGLSSIAIIEEYGSIVVQDNDALTDLDGLQKTVYPKEIIIQDNASLESLYGLEGLTQLDVTLQLSGNPVLTSIESLANLTGTIERLIIEDNASLENLVGLAGVTEVKWKLQLSGNPKLASLESLANLTNTLGYLVIEDNDALESLAEISGVTVIGQEGDGGDLIIRGNGALTSLNGLENLTNIVPDTSGFYRGNLYIQDNPLLPTSEAEALRDRLVANGWTGQAFISGNGA